MGRTKHRQKPIAPRLRPDLQRRELDVATLHGHLDRVRETLGEEGFRDLKQAVDTLGFLSQEVERGKTSLSKLQLILYGPKTESTAAVTGGKAAARRKPKDPADKAPGHGRNGAAAFTGAERVKVPLAGFHSGDPCPTPDCNGKVYPLAEPATLIRMKGVAPFQATIYALERWRCSDGCELVFTAPAPAGVGASRYDASVAALIAEMRYGTGLPHNRIERLQQIFGIPLPVSTQWELVLWAANLLQPAYAELIRQAAQGELLHNDDTPMRILKKVTPVGKEDRKAIQTTALLSQRGATRIALFLTGMRHAGENLEAVLKFRAEDLARPIQMCDGLAANLVGEDGKVDTLLSNCLAHARRKFVEVETKFPAEVNILLRFLRVVYRLDARTKARQMAPAARLAYHQARSKPVMEKLKGWLQKLVDEKRMEPNCGLGDAVAYLQKRWTEMTLFLREPGAVLDNTACERVVKRAIMHRKNSLFYQTQKGAWVGDLFMSIIHTAELNAVPSFDYLLAMLRNPEAVKMNPGAWMPWNYHQQADPMPVPVNG